MAVYTADEECPVTWKQAKVQFETAYVTELLEFTGGNVTRAAGLAEKDRKDFYDVLKRCAVEPNDFRAKPIRRRPCQR